MLTAYCDESGKHESAKEFVIAGLRADVKTWQKFQKAWNAALLEANISAFHMNDCEHGWGEFKNRSLEEREELQRRFIEIINAHRLLLVSLSIPRDLFHHAVNPVGDKRYKKHPYFFIFHSFVHLMLKQPEGLGSGRKVNFLFDRQDEFSGFARFELWNRIKDDPSYEHRSNLGDLSFVSKKDPDSSFGIQAADIVAYELYQIATEEERFKVSGLKLRWQTRLLFRKRYGTPRCVIAQWQRDSIAELHSLDALERATINP